MQQPTWLSIVKIQFLSEEANVNPLKNLETIEAGEDANDGRMLASALQQSRLWMDTTEGHK